MMTHTLPMTHFNQDIEVADFGKKPSIEIKSNIKRTVSELNVGTPHAEGTLLRR